MSGTSLKNYVCAVPFKELEIQNPRKMLCCASWLKLWLPSNLSAKEAWNSDQANEIRRSVLDGSFKYCDKKECPFLSNLVNTGRANGTIFHKDNLPEDIKERIVKFENKEEIHPYTLQFSFDSTCNLKCPSCRNHLIVEDKKGIGRVKEEIEKLKSDFSTTTKRLYITGTGDPFVSVGFRDFLRTFKSEEWPVLERIHLHTNATKWNKQMWDSMPQIHKYVKTCEISIDAATKDTYENKVRLGGNWDELIDNLNFISTIPTLQSVKTSFVVQYHNYKEIKLFDELISDIFGKKATVYYGKILNWGNQSSEIFENNQVWNKSHSEYSNFIEELSKFPKIKNGWHNLHEFIDVDKPLI